PGFPDLGAHRRSDRYRRNCPTPRDRGGDGMGHAASRDANPQMGRADRKRMSMPRKAFPRIAAVAPSAKPFTLQIRWSTGGETLVDVSGIIHSFHFYSPLRHDPERFRQVRVGEN